MPHRHDDDARRLPERGPEREEEWRHAFRRGQRGQSLVEAGGGRMIGPGYEHGLAPAPWPPDDELRRRALGLGPDFDDRGLFSGGRSQHFDELRHRELGIAQPYAGAGRFRGVGPRGWRRSDERILDDIVGRARYELPVDLSEVEIRVDQGVVTLEGSVVTRSDKRDLEDLVADVPGVEDVLNRIRVSHGPPARRR